MVASPNFLYLANGEMKYIKVTYIWDNHAHIAAILYNRASATTGTAPYLICALALSQLFDLLLYAMVLIKSSSCSHMQGF